MINLTEFWKSTQWVACLFVKVFTETVFINREVATIQCLWNFQAEGKLSSSGLLFDFIHHGSLLFWSFSQKVGNILQNKENFVYSGDVIPYQILVPTGFIDKISDFTPEGSGLGSGALDEALTFQLRHLNLTSRLTKLLGNSSKTTDLPLKLICVQASTSQFLSKKISVCTLEAKT